MRLLGLVQKVRRLSGFPGIGLLLACKLFLGALFASNFLYGLFIPFLNISVATPFINPWQAAIEHGIPNAFPYGPVMFYLMVLPRFLLLWAIPSDPFAVTWLHLLAARIPLLAVDAAIYWMMVRYLNIDHIRATIFWWTSPIILYVTYIHGQLDLIPTAILMASLVLLVKGRYFWSAVTLGLGLATKNHLFVALPFMIIFATRKETSWAQGFMLGGTALGVYAGILFPWVLNEGFRKMVFGTEEQERVFKVALDYLPKLQLYLAPLIIGFLFFRFATYKKVNRDTLFMFLGLAFTVMISLLPPAHGYYIWPLPFVIYFFAQQTDYSRVSLWAFNVSCLVYLALGLDSTLFDSVGIIFPRVANWGPPILLLDQFGLNIFHLNSLLFTIMQASIWMLAFIMYRHGVQSNIIYRPKTRPVLIGVGGDSSSGKHTARDILADILGVGHVLSVDGDDIHKWERGHEMWKVLSHLDPEGNDLYLQLQYAKALGRGQTVSKVRYDHRTGKFTQPEEVSPSRFIFFVGLHPFYLKRMRETIDIKIYMDTDEELRRSWKIRRDVRERGYTSEGVIEQLNGRQKDAALFIHPQKQFADMAVRYYQLANTGGFTNDAGQAFGISIRVDNSVPISRLAERIMQVPTLKTNHQHLDNLLYQEFIVEGDISSYEVQKIASEVIPQLSELVGSKPHWRDNHNGILQLCFLLLLSDLLLDRPDLALD